MHEDIKKNFFFLKTKNKKMLIRNRSVGELVIKSTFNQHVYKTHGSRKNFTDCINKTIVLEQLSWYVKMTDVLVDGKDLGISGGTLFFDTEHSENPMAVKINDEFIICLLKDVDDIVNFYAFNPPRTLHRLDPSRLEHIPCLESTVSLLHVAVLFYGPFIKKSLRNVSINACVCVREDPSSDVNSEIEKAKKIAQSKWHKNE